MSGRVTDTGLTGSPGGAAEPRSGTTGTIHQISVSKGGVPKLAMPEAEVTVSGVGGDRQRNLRVHGGPDRAVCLYSLDVIEALRAEGHPIAPGTVGENVTVSGLAWSRIVPGARLRLGTEVLLEVTKYTAPCTNIAGSFCDGDFSRISVKLHPEQSRVYTRVLSPGRIRAGDQVVLL